MKQLSDALIMIVDDNPQNLKILASLLETFNCELQICTDGQEALDALKLDLPDLILLDVMMPDIDGFEVCRRIRENPFWQDMPIIFLTAKSTSEDIITGFEVGGNDYVTKPFNEAELLARVRNLLELKRIRDALKERNAEMEVLVSKLATASATDPLTGLVNRRAMTARLNEEVARFYRHNRGFVLLMGDIDYFKRINDSYGHDGGDVVLKSMAQRMNAHLRREDLVARWGGEEFLILLPDTDEAGGYTFAERMRVAIANEAFTYNEHQFQVTLTLGLCAFKKHHTLDKAILLADQALYLGKQHGRNQVYISKE